MNRRARIHPAGLLPIALLAACTITRHVEPLPAEQIPAVCIKENPDTWSKEFLPELQSQFEEHGIRSTVYETTAPADCRYRVEYDANWYWDMAIYLKYADVRVYEGDRMVGRATYDARDGSARMDKFGRTETKLESVVDELLKNVNHAPATP